MNEHDAESAPPIHLPPPTPWPMVLGLGMAMMMAGMIVFLRGMRLASGQAELLGGAQAAIGVPILGAVIFFAALTMMLRDDMKDFEHGGHGH